MLYNCVLSGVWCKKPPSRSGNLLTMILLRKDPHFFLPMSPQALCQLPWARTCGQWPGHLTGRFLKFGDALWLDYLHLYSWFSWLVDFTVHHFTIDSKRLNYYQLWLQWLVHLRLKSIVIPLLKYLTNFDPISLTMGRSFDYNASITLFGWVPICGFIPYSIMIYYIVAFFNISMGDGTNL